MEGPEPAEGNQKHVQNEAGQSDMKNSSEEAPTEDVGEFAALINYVIRRNDEVSAPVCFKAKLKRRRRNCHISRFVLKNSGKTV